MKTLFIEVEMAPGQWVPVEPSQLTDDHELPLDPTTDPEVLEGSSWYVDGDYTSPPKPIRVKTLKAVETDLLLALKGSTLDGEGLVVFATERYHPVIDRLREEFAETPGYMVAELEPPFKGVWQFRLCHPD